MGGDGEGKPSYYAVMGVARDASPEAIRNAHRRLSMDMVSAYLRPSRAKIQEAYNGKCFYDFIYLLYILVVCHVSAELLTECVHVCGSAQGPRQEGGVRRGPERGDQRRRRRRSPERPGEGARRLIGPSPPCAQNLYATPYPQVPPEQRQRLAAPFAGWPTVTRAEANDQLVPICMYAGLATKRSSISSGGMGCIWILLNNKRCVV